LAILNPDRDIDDEALWGIINQREAARKVWEMEQFGRNLVLRYNETQLQDRPGDGGRLPDDMFFRPQFQQLDQQQ